MGGHYLIARDFRDPQSEDDEVRLSLTKKTMESVGALTRFIHRWRSSTTKQDIESRHSQQSYEGVEVKEKLGGSCTTTPPSPSSRSLTGAIIKHATFNHEESTMTPTEIEQQPPVLEPPLEISHPTTQIPIHHPSEQKRFHRYLKKVLYFLQNLLTVPTMAVVSSFVIAVVQPLKGLFVLLPSSPHAPDGQPPLAFILDAATFLGGASVPLGLICLGSALARLNVPRNEWRALPLGSIMCLAFGRMVLQPVLGVLIVRGLTHVNIISPDDKVLQFVCM